MGFYEKCIQDKSSGNLIKWEDLTRDQLFELYCGSIVVDSMVADLFGVSVSKVRYARKKHGITMQLISIYQLMNGEDRPPALDEIAKAELLSDAKADALAIGLAHNIFRNGPIEDMHANGQLSEEDMMTLNKHMVNRIATILFLAKKGYWVELKYFLQFDMYCGSEWDKPVIELYDVYKILELMVRT